jgi:hypothetical protein
MPSRPRAQPEPLPQVDTGSTHLYRVTPADGSAQLLIEWDGGHMVQAGALVHAPIVTASRLPWAGWTT